MFPSSKKISSQINSLSLKKGFVSFSEALVKNISEICSRIFLENFQYTSTITYDEYSSLSFSQKKTINKVYNLDESPNDQNFPLRIYPPVLFRKKVENIFLEELTKISSRNPVELKITNYINPSPTRVPIELLKQLHYYCFFSVLSNEDAYGIINALPYDSDVYPNIKDVVVLFHYEESYSFSFEVPPFYLFLDHISHSIIISIKNNPNIYDVFDYLLKHIMEKDLEKKIKEIANSIGAKCSKKIEKWKNVWPEYSIKIIGHGYSAMIGSVLLECLTEQYNHSDVKAILFNCPPIFSLEKVEKYYDKIITVVFGWDILSNFSYKNIYEYVIDDYKNDQQDSKKLFVPGTVYWLYYNENRSVENIQIILKSNERFQNLILHTSIIEDNDISTIYMYLLGMIMKENDINP